MRECPLALEAVRALLQLGVKPREVEELAGEAQAQLLPSRQVRCLG